MAKIRIVDADFYFASPIKGLDALTTEFRGTEIAKVPLIRIFGATDDGFKTCLHVHGVFPYIYIPYDGKENCEVLRYKLANAIDRTLNVALGQAASKAQHVYNIILVSGIPFYGYHAREHQFLKILFYNPHLMKKVCTFLENGAILGRIYQPHEAHIPYIQQFMIQYNLHGMSFIHLSDIHHRHHRTGNTTPDLTKPGNHMLTANIARMSRCDWECDTQAESILNVQDVAPNAMTNPGITSIWADERLRRIDISLSSQVSHILTQNRNDLEPTQSHILYRHKLREQLLSQSSRTDKQEIDANISIYPAETPESGDFLSSGSDNLDVSYLIEANENEQIGREACENLEVVLRDLAEANDLTQRLSVPEDSILSQLSQGDNNLLEDTGLDTEEECELDLSMPLETTPHKQQTVLKDESEDEFNDLSDSYFINIPQLDGTYNLRSNSVKTSKTVKCTSKSTIMNSAATDNLKTVIKKIRNERANKRIVTTVSNSLRTEKTVKRVRHSIKNSTVTTSNRQKETMESNEKVKHRRTTRNSKKYFEEAIDKGIHDTPKTSKHLSSQKQMKNRRNLKQDQKHPYWNSDYFIENVKNLREMSSSPIEKTKLNDTERPKAQNNTSMIANNREKLQSLITDPKHLKRNNTRCKNQRLSNETAKYLSESLNCRENTTYARNVAKKRQIFSHFGNCPIDSNSSKKNPLKKTFNQRGCGGPKTINDIAVVQNISFKTSSSTVNELKSPSSSHNGNNNIEINSPGFFYSDSQIETALKTRSRKLILHDSAQRRRPRRPRILKEAANIDSGLPSLILGNIETKLNPNLSKNNHKKTWNETCVKSPLINNESGNCDTLNKIDTRELASQYKSFSMEIPNETIKSQKWYGSLKKRVFKDASFQCSDGASVKSRYCLRNRRVNEINENNLIEIKKRRTTWENVLYMQFGGTTTNPMELLELSYDCPCNDDQKVEADAEKSCSTHFRKTELRKNDCKKKSRLIVQYAAQNCKKQFNICNKKTKNMRYKEVSLKGCLSGKLPCCHVRRHGNQREIEDDSGTMHSRNTISTKVNDMPLLDWNNTFCTPCMPPKHSFQKASRRKSASKENVALNGPNATPKLQIILSKAANELKSEKAKIKALRNITHAKKLSNKTLRYRKKLRSKHLEQAVQKEMIKYIALQTGRKPKFNIVYGKRFPVIPLDINKISFNQFPNTEWSNELVKVHRTLPFNSNKIVVLENKILADHEKYEGLAHVPQTEIIVDSSTNVVNNNWLDTHVNISDFDNSEYSLDALDYDEPLSGSNGCVHNLSDSENILDVDQLLDDICNSQDIANINEQMNFDKLEDPYIIKHPTNFEEKLNNIMSCINRTQTDINYLRDEYDNEEKAAEIQFKLDKNNYRSQLTMEKFRYMKRNQDRTFENIRKYFSKYVENFNVCGRLVMQEADRDAREAKNESSDDDEDDVAVGHFFLHKTVRFKKRIFVREYVPSAAISEHLFNDASYRLETNDHLQWGYLNRFHTYDHLLKVDGPNDSSEDEQRYEVRTKRARIIRKKPSYKSLPLTCGKLSQVTHTGLTMKQ